MKVSSPRTITLVRPLDEWGVGVFRITANNRTNYYAFHEIPCEIGGRGFELHKLGLGTLYHVRVGARRDCSCECLGFLRHSKCKHISGLLALIRQQLLPPRDLQEAKSA